VRLFTICTNGLPVLVMSAGAEPPLPDSLTTNVALMKAHRELSAQMDNLPDYARYSVEIHEVLDTWLGADLRSQTYNGTPLWNGDLDSLQIREARTDEAERWHVSRRHAINEGELDAGAEDWLVYLVSPSDD
jgi:hypothetical protein